MRSLTRILRFTSQLWKFYLGVVISAVIVAITQLAVPFVIARATDLAVAGVRGNDHHIRDIMLLAVVILVLDVDIVQDLQHHRCKIAVFMRD